LHDTPKKGIGKVRRSEEVKLSSRARETQAGLAKRGLDVTYPLLAAYQSNVGVRQHSLLKLLQEWRESFTKASSSSGIEGQLVRRMHFEQLEILLHLCMFIEDFAYVSWGLKHRPRSLHRALRFDGGMRNQAIVELCGLGDRSLRARFRFPKYTRLCMGKNDERVVREVFDTITEGLCCDLRRVQEFLHKRYFDVCNEYKHTFDVITGMYQTDTARFSSHVYVRATRGKKGRQRQVTYILDAGPKAIDYYEEVFSSTSNLINVLISNSLDYCAYHDGRYLIKLPLDYRVAEDVKALYEALIGKYSLGWSKGHSLQLAINITGGALRRLEGSLADDHIGVLKRHLFSRGKATRSDLSFADSTGSRETHGS
jgi:hypothetical protein